MAVDVFDEAIAALRDYLAFEIEEGRSTVELTEALPAAGTRPPSTSPAPAPAPAPTRPARDDTSAPGEMAAITATIATCTRCALHETRTNTVPGQGHASPELMFVGEAPGADEDQQGLAFVGRAGQLLTKMIAAMGFTRDDVFIGNILKCRPPNNRKPTPDEMQICLPYLKQQIAILKPRVIVCLGATATEGLLGLKGITKLRGNWHTFEGIDVMPTYHPAYLLRNPAAKHDTWADLQTVLARLGKAPPPRG